MDTRHNHPNEVNQRRDSPLLAHAARWAETRANLVAAALAAYRAAHGLDEPALAAELGCNLTALHGLALCNRPSPVESAFAAELQGLAAYVGCDAGRLEAVLREVSSAYGR